MNKILYIFLFATLFFAACSSDDIPNDQPDGDKQIELRFSVKNFQGESVTRATIAGTEDENKIKNLCLFIIKSNNIAHKYYMDDDTFDGGSGSWDENNTILLGLTASDVGEADVYVVANAGDITDDIEDYDDLKDHVINTTYPWSDNITTPLIMSGSETHNFANNPVLSTVELTRAVAKVEITVTLSKQYQSEPKITYQDKDYPQYKYQLLNFDKQTYLFKPDNKTSDSEDLVSQSAWTTWSDNLTTYDADDNEGIVTTLKFVTYVNERDAGDATTINVILPYWDNGMPPPQFMDDPLPIKLPTKIERNHYYKVDVQM